MRLSMDSVNAVTLAFTRILAFREILTVQHVIVVINGTYI